MQLRLTIVLLCLAFAVMPAAAQNETCFVPENYVEALDENIGTLLAVNVALNTGGGMLNDIDAAEVYYKVLISMRQFHADERADLPDCAQPVNNAAIDGMSAAQDAIGFMFLRQANPTDVGQYERELESSISQLRASFADLNDTLSEAGLIGERS